MLELSEEALQIILSIRRKLELEEGVHVPSVKDTRALSKLLAHASRSHHAIVLQLHKNFMKTLNVEQALALNIQKVKAHREHLRSTVQFSLALRDRRLTRNTQKKKKMIYRGQISWV